MERTHRIMFVCHGRVDVCVAYTGITPTRRGITFLKYIYGLL